MKTLLNYEFEYIQDLKPALDKLGRIIEYSPQENYMKKDFAVLNKYGSGTFCKFSIDSKWFGISGVYAFFVDGTLVYIGQAIDFAQRFNMGYGNISPKNCFVGGQSTNCKINKMVLNSVKSGKVVSVYFYTTKDYNVVERNLIMHYKPPYNSALNCDYEGVSIDEEKSRTESSQLPKSVGNLTRLKNPSVIDVRKFIQNEIERAKEQGDEEIEICSGAIHKRLNMVNAMPTVCSAMRTLDGEYKYEVIEEPPKGNGSRLIFKYILW